MNAVAWFRSDLRADDNGALHAASAAGGAVAGLFLVCDGQWAAHGWGPRRVRFTWLQALALREELARRGIPLWIQRVPHFADAPAAVAAFARRHAAAVVCASAEAGVDETARDEATARALRAQGTGWRLLHDATLLEPGSVLTREGLPFRVFTPFRRALLERLRGEAPDCLPAPHAGAAVAPPPLPGWEPDGGSVDERWWPAGERAARDRLERFCNLPIARYHEDRDIPSLDGTSRLSPYLATGAISVRRCVEAALAANGGEWDAGEAGPRAWLTELVWREFYLHLMHAFPALSRHRAMRAETEAIPWRAAGEDFAAWCEGRTGFPLVDAGMRQLAAVGWMHNRVRMVTAMFLSKLLLVDWRRGEQHFMQQLVDGDLAANNGGWQWSASTGTDAAPYFRILSPERQAERFDAGGEYVRRYVPEIASCSTKALLKPGHPELLARGYPAPMLDPAAARARALGAFRAVADEARRAS